MNGLTAKRLRRFALKVLQAEGISGGEGYNKYKQVKNRIYWEKAFDDQGLRMRDPGGTPLLKPVRTGGTIFTQWKFRIVYKNLKKLWKKTKGRHIIFQKGIKK